jgi:hypothetical protein
VWVEPTVIHARRRCAARIALRSEAILFEEHSQARGIQKRLLREARARDDGFHPVSRGFLARRMLRMTSTPSSLPSRSTSSQIPTACAGLSERGPPPMRMLLR